MGRGPVVPGRSVHHFEGLVAQLARLGGGVIVAEFVNSRLLFLNTTFCYDFCNSMYLTCQLTSYQPIMAKQKKRKLSAHRRKQVRHVPTHPNIVNAEEAAKALGVSKWLLLRMARDGEIPGRKVGREWRFQLSTLDKWIGGESEYAALASTIRGKELKVTRKK